MANVNVKLKAFKLTKTHDGDDDEDLDVTVTVNGHVLYRAHNENHIVGQAYGNGKSVQLDVADAVVQVEGHTASADYHKPNYGSDNRTHKSDGEFRLEGALNGGEWFAEYVVSFR